MFLHIGADVIINKKEIVAIFDLESATNAQSTRDFLMNVNEERSIVSICEQGKERSCVITKKNVYLSPISSYTLMKRANSKTLSLGSD